MAKKIQPLGDKLLVRPYTQEETTASGIILPETASKERPEEGEVLAIGPGGKADDGTRIAIDEIAVGDTIVFTKYGPQEIKVDGEELLLVSIKDVLAKIEK